jgi:hypothetical protein
MTSHAAARSQHGLPAPVTHHPRLSHPARPADHRYYQHRTSESARIAPRITPPHNTRLVGVRRVALTARFARSSHWVTAARPHRGGLRVLDVPNSLPAIRGLLAAKV